MTDAFTSLPPTTRFGYVLKVFPRVSETFVANEIRALEGLGESVSVFSLHHPQSVVPHRMLRELRGGICYIEDIAADETEVPRARRHLERGLALPVDLRERAVPRKYVRLALGLSAMVHRQRIDRLHAHFASRSGHVTMLAAFLSGVPYSLTAHAKDIYQEDVDRDLLRLKIARADFVVTVTEYNRRHLQELVRDLPGAAEKIVRIYNGIDLQRFRPTPQPAAEPPLILSVGRLVEKKGFAVLIEACRLLLQRGRAFGCEIIGGGAEEEAALRQQIAAAGLEKIVQLRGVLATEQVAKRLRDATVVTLACVVGRDGNVDALPTVLLEAMATARPVVSTRVSGIPEIVTDGETGFLVRPADPVALADAFARILDEPQQAAAMGVAGRRRAELLFDLHRNVEELRRLLYGERQRSSAS